jgi:hypothetical protein
MNVGRVLASAAIAVSVLAAGAAPASAGGETTAPTCPASIESNFNGTRIPGGSTIWFNAVLKAKGVNGSAATLKFTNSSIQFGGNSYPVPDGTVNFSSVTQATTTFGAGNSPTTTVPKSFGDNVFFAALAFPVPSGLPGGIKPVTWQGQFSSSRPGITVQWQWGAAVYNHGFQSDLNNADVKPVHSKSIDAYHNGDQAGTPENPWNQQYLIGGARGGGGSNFTGSYSSTGTCSWPPPTCCLCSCSTEPPPTEPPPPPT